MSVIKICAICGGDFSTRDGRYRAKTCGEGCSTVYKRQRDRERNRRQQRAISSRTRACKHCAAPFRPAPGLRLYCSCRCRDLQAQHRSQTRRTREREEMAPKVIPGMRELLCSPWGRAR